MPGYYVKFETVTVGGLHYQIRSLLDLAQALGVSDEIKTLYSQAFHIELTHVESVFGENDQALERTEFKFIVYGPKRLSTFISKILRIFKNEP